MYEGGIQTFVKYPCEIKSVRLSDDEFLGQISDHTLRCPGSEGKSTGKTRAFLNILFKDFKETNLIFKVGGRVPMPPVCSSQSRERKHDL